MFLLFASFYFVPALFAALIFAALWRSIRSFDLAPRTLRVFFTLLGALFFAPMVVPAGTIMTAWVPHAVLLASPDLGYYFWVPQYAFASFAVTAAAFFVAAMVAIRTPRTPKGLDWKTLTLPLLAIAVTFVFFKAVIPCRKIPTEINTASVESVYGSSIDAVIALHDIGDAAEQAAAAAELRNRFSEDSAIIHVSLQDPGRNGTVYGQVFYFYQGDVSPPSKNCAGAAPPEQKGLIRCSWKGGGASRRNVIRYKRRFSIDDEKLSVVFEFDMKALRKSLREASSS